MPTTRIYGWFLCTSRVTHSQTLHYFRWGKSICGRVKYSVKRCEPQTQTDVGVIVCQWCVRHAVGKPQAVARHEKKLFG